jgi:hypothetical protein
VNISEFLDIIEARISSARGEEEVRHLFLNELEKFCENHQIQIEIRLEESVLKGRTDARIGLIVYEFKGPHVLDSVVNRNKALSKMETYLEGYSKRPSISRSKLRGFITDGVNAASISYDTRTDNFTPCNVYEKPVPHDRAFVGLKDTAIWFDTILSTMAKRELSPENLLEDFGPQRPICRMMVSALWRTLANRINTDERMEKFYEQWRILFSTATQKVIPGKELTSDVRQYGLEVAEIQTPDDVRKFLFIIHTYYSIILKLLAVRIVDELSLIGRVSLLKGIVSDPMTGFKEAENTLPKLAANLIERDVFSWFQSSLSEDLWGAISKAAEKLQDYDLKGVRRDVLKRVYQKIIPNKLRKALGEFYTKDWVAEMVLDEASYHGEGSLLDPACGSGTFLALAIGRKKDLLSGIDPQAALDQIISTITGFDVNPIAVITARMNYLLSILDLLRDSKFAGGITLPVYLCDSVVIPEETFDIGTGITYKLRTAIGEIVLPKVDQKSIEILLDVTETYSTTSVETYLEAVRGKLGYDFESSYRNVLKNLHHRMHDLETRKVDGVWMRFIRNFFAPILLPKQDFVVGNPPWVAPVHVPKEYRDAVRQQLKNSGYQEPYDPEFRITKARTRAAETAYVACLPFMHLALNRYLRTGGSLAFLLTSSILRTRNSGGWREKLLSYQFEKIVDLSLITDIHEGALCWSFIPLMKNEKRSDKQIEYVYVTRKERPNSKADPELSPKLAKHEWSLSSDSISLTKDRRSPWLACSSKVADIFHSMYIYPRIGDLYRINNGVNPAANEVYFLWDPVLRQDGLVEAKSKKGRKVLVEPEVVFPLIKGENIKEWAFSNEYIIIPHDPKTGKVIPPGSLRNKYPEAYSYLSEHKDRLQARRFFTPGKGVFYSIYAFSSSKLKSWKVSYAKHSIVLETSIIPPFIEDSKLQRKVPVVFDTSAYMISVPNKNEGYYLAACANSLPLRSLAYTLGEPKGGAPWKQYFQWTIGILPLPLYDSKNDIHRELVRLSREAHSRKAVNMPEISSLVGKIYGLSEDQLDVLADHLDSLKGIMPSEKNQK